MPPRAISESSCASSVRSSDDIVARTSECCNFKDQTWLFCVYNIDISLFIYLDDTFIHSIFLWRTVLLYVNSVVARGRRNSLSPEEHRSTRRTGRGLAFLRNSNTCATPKPLRSSLQHLNRIIELPHTTRSLNLHLMARSSQRLAITASLHEPDVFFRGALAVEAGRRLDEVELRCVGQNGSGDDLRPVELRGLEDELESCWAWSCGAEG